MVGCLERSSAVAAADRPQPRIRQQTITPRQDRPAKCAVDLRKYFVLPSLRAVLPGRSEFAAFSADGRWLALGSEYDPARLFDLSAPAIAQSMRILAESGSRLQQLAFTSDSRWLLTEQGGPREEVRLWDPYARLLTPIDVGSDESRLREVRVSQDGRWLVTVLEDFSLRLWNLEARKIAGGPLVLHGYEKPISACLFTSDSRRLITGSDDGTLRVWELDPDAKTASSRTLPGHPEGEFVIRASADGRWLITSSRDPAAWLWDLSAPRLETSGRRVPGHDARVHTIVFSPDSRWLATLAHNSQLRLWDLHAKEPLANAVTLQAGRESLLAVKFSPDSRWLATIGNIDYQGGGDDKIVRLWKLTATGHESPRFLRGHEERIADIAAIAAGWSPPVKTRPPASGISPRKTRPSRRSSSVSPAGHWRPARTVAGSPAQAACGICARTISSREPARPSDEISRLRSGSCSSPESLTEKPSVICRSRYPSKDPEVRKENRGDLKKRKFTHVCDPFGRLSRSITVPSRSATYLFRLARNIKVQRQRALATHSCARLRRCLICYSSIVEDIA